MGWTGCGSSMWEWNNDVDDDDGRNLQYANKLLITQGFARASGMHAATAPQSILCHVMFRKGEPLPNGCRISNNVHRPAGRDLN